MSNALEMGEDPGEMKCYLTRGQALEPFPVTLGTNIVFSPPVRYLRTGSGSIQSHTYRSWLGCVTWE